MSSQSPTWAELQRHQRRLANIRLPRLFDLEPDRLARMCLSVEGLHIDFSKQLVDAAAMYDLLRLCAELDLPTWRERLFTGDRVNLTEQRPALHTALRAQSSAPLLIDGLDRMPEIRGERARVRAFCAKFRAGELRGSSGAPLDRVLSIGIGGSLWGPALAVEALAGTARDRIHFVSGLDGGALARALAACDPARTLVVVSSKSFSTAETLTNAAAAKTWLAAAGAATPMQQFVAVTANIEQAQAAGYAPEQVFGLWDWVGGRYSLWSAIGLSAELITGTEQFDQLLAGAAAMDDHFRNAPPERNAPLLLGLLDVWYASLWDTGTSVLLPYDEGLRLLPTYVQQLAMESNGKRIRRDGRPVEHPTEPVIWGGSGNDGQHTYYQLLHQGTRLIPAEFLCAVNDDSGYPGQRRALVANCLAQAEALLVGSEPGDPHKHCPGGRPSTSILFDRLTPYLLGALIALYEHRVFVQAVCWEINPFDQFGVELGKRLATQLEEELQTSAVTGRHDPSTLGLLKRVAELLDKTKT